MMRFRKLRSLINQYADRHAELYWEKDQGWDVAKYERREAEAKDALERELVRLENLIPSRRQK